jgi:hypothetical protein
MHQRYVCLSDPFIGEVLFHQPLDSFDDTLTLMLISCITLPQNPTCFVATIVIKQNLIIILSLSLLIIEVFGALSRLDFPNTMQSAPPHRLNEARAFAQGCGPKKLFAFNCLIRLVLLILLSQNRSFIFFIFFNNWGIWGFDRPD